jgi:nucleotide-binding universal stress UspA family protein
VILVPLDFSQASRSALRYAASLVRQFGGKLTLFYALEPVATPDFAYHPLMMQPREASAQAEQHLRKMCEQEGVDPKFIDDIVVRSGTAHAEITRAAERMNADLIVIATHGNTGLKHVLLGSTAERVVRHAHCPVLVLRG